MHLCFENLREVPLLFMQSIYQKVGDHYRILDHTVHAKRGLECRRLGGLS